MLRDQNGNCYRTAGSMQQFDPNNPDLNLFNHWDAESIRIGGSPIYYFECLIQPQSIDQLYLEDRGKIFSQIPVELYAFYEPIASQNAQGTFGIDSPDEMIFELNYDYVLKTLGHPPKVGSRIFTPHLRENWVIVQRNTGEFKMWNVLRLQILAQKFQESVTTGEGKVTQNSKVPDFKII